MQGELQSLFGMRQVVCFSAAINVLCTLYTISCKFSSKKVQVNRTAPDEKADATQFLYKVHVDQYMHTAVITGLLIGCDNKTGIT